MGQFARQIESFSSKTEVKASKILRRVSLDVLRRLIVRSPVDTGRFRGNWTTGINDLPSGEEREVDKTGSVTISDGESDITSAKFGDRVFIVNNLPYALRLENGWSQQAPGGMVAITVAEWPGIVRDAVDANR